MEQKEEGLRRVPRDAFCGGMLFRRRWVLLLPSLMVGACYLPTYVHLGRFDTLVSVSGIVTLDQVPAHYGTSQQTREPTTWLADNLGSSERMWRIALEDTWFDLLLPDVAARNLFLRWLCLSMCLVADAGWTGHRSIYVSC